MAIERKRILTAILIWLERPRYGMLCTITPVSAGASLRAMGFSQGKQVGIGSLDRELRTVPTPAVQSVEVPSLRPLVHGVPGHTSLWGGIEPHDRLPVRVCILSSWLITDQGLPGRFLCEGRGRGNGGNP